MAITRAMVTTTSLAFTYGAVSVSMWTDGGWSLLRSPPRSLPRYLRRLFQRTARWRRERARR